MNVGSIIVLILFGGLVIWLLIDTIIAVIKKIKVYKIAVIKKNNAQKKDVEPKE